MSIEFRCLTCGKLLRVADESAGKKSRCPECGNIQDIPGEPRLAGTNTGGGYPTGTENAATGSPFSGFSTEPPYGPSTRASSSPSPFGMPAAGQGSGVNPYADQPDNPYHSPAGGYGAQGGVFAGPMTERVIRGKVQAPAVAMMVMSIIELLGLSLMLLGGLVNIAEHRMDEGDLVLLVWVIGSMAIRAVVLAAGVQMQRLRSHTLGMTGAILSLIPCTGCVPLDIGFGIWALMVLSDPSVRAAFR